MSTHSKSYPDYRFFRYIPPALILFAGICYCFMGFFMPPLGDDLGFINTFEEQNDAWFALPRSMYRHWIWNNARMADMLSPVWLCFLPEWIRALLHGVFTSLFLLLIIRLCRLRKAFRWQIQTLIIALVIFTFRWDAIWMEYVATFNYVWSAVFGLIAILMLFRKPADSRNPLWWAAAAFCFLASSMHEALGVPIALGVLFYSAVAGIWSKQNASGKAMIVAMIAGGLFTLTSPASYSRVGGMLQPEPVRELLLFSGGYVVILVIVIIALLIAGKKTILIRLSKTEWSVFAIGACVSTCFMLLSRYGGRTGWFAQTFAIIALFRMLRELPSVRISKQIRIATSVIASILAIAVVLHLALLAGWQKKLGTEARQAISLMQKSTDGLIFLDFTPDTAQPWYLLRKPHGVPDADDTYYRARVSKYYCNEKEVVILPEKAENLLKRGKSQFREGDIFVSDRQLDAVYGDTIFPVFPRVFAKIDGREYVESPFSYNGKNLFLYSPVDRDPGEK